MQRTGDSSRFLPIDFKDRFPALDGIRALAVTMVFLLHFGGGSHGGRVLQMFNAFRQHLVVGVDMFFVLSGFLITGILFDTTSDSHFFKRFFARRSVRIFPIVYLLFTVILLLTPVLKYQWHWEHLSFLVYMGNMVGNYNFDYYAVKSKLFPVGAEANIGHLWSLCVEEQFYLIWPLIVFYIRDRKKLIWTCFGVAGLSLALRFWMVMACTPDTAERWVYRTLPFRLDDLVLGAALALMLRGPSADRVQRACKWLFWAGFLPSVAIDWLQPDTHSPWQLTLALTTVAVASMGLIGMTLRPQSICYRIFSLRPARVLGKYSYGFYVWHLVWINAWIQLLVVITHRTHSLAVAGLVELPLAFITSFLVAKLSYDLFEVRFLKYKRNFEYDSELRTHKTAFAPDGN